MITRFKAEWKAWKDTIQEHEFATYLNSKRGWIEVYNLLTMNAYKNEKCTVLSSIIYYHLNASEV